MVCVICSKHEHIGSFITRCPNYKNKMMPQIKLRSIDVMIRKLDCSVYYNNRTEKLLKLEPKKIKKSDENLRAELTHILLTRQHNA